MQRANVFSDEDEDGGKVLEDIEAEIFEDYFKDWYLSCTPNCLKTLLLKGRRYFVKSILKRHILARDKEKEEKSKTSLLMSMVSNINSTISLIGKLADIGLLFFIAHKSMSEKNQLNPDYKVAFTVATLSILSGYLVSYGNIMFKKFRLGHYEASTWQKYNCL